MWYIINLFLVSLLLFCSGCGPIKSGAKKVSEVSLDTLSAAKYKLLPKKKEPKKKVLIIPFECAWNPKSEFGSKVSFKFAKNLKEIPSNILVYLPKKPSSWKVIGPVPRFGIIKNKDLIRDASSLGMHYLVTGIMDVMKVGQKPIGVWPFRHYDQIFESVLVINVIDTVTGALVESHMESAKFNIPTKDIPKNQDKLFMIVLKHTLHEIIRAQTKMVTKVIEKDTWKGKILQVYKNLGKIKISGGKDVGIKKGMLFKVFNWGKEIYPLSGHPFYYLGKKIGIIKVVSVKDNYSLAIPLNKADYKRGLPITFD